MAEIRRPGAAYVKLSINQVELVEKEIEFVSMDFELGNKMSKLTLKIRSDRKVVLENCIIEMSIIRVELGTCDPRGAVIDKKVGRYFLTKTNYIPQNDNEQMIEIIGITDAYKYLAQPKLFANDRRGNVTEYLEKISGIGSGSSGDGTIKIDIKDGLIGRAKDNMFWIQHDVSGIEAMNAALVRCVAAPNSNSSQKSPSNMNEWVYTSVIDFNKAGDPVVYLYDVKLRTRTFPVKTFVDGRTAKFSFKKIPGGITYNTTKLDIKGADYSALYWRRSSFAIDVEENSSWYRKMRYPELFEDSAPYTKQQDFDGNTGIPDEMMMFESNERFELENYNTNMHHRYYVDQKVQATVTMLALKKINVHVNVSNDFLNLSPIDICYLEIPSPEDKSRKATYKRLTGKYMVTRVIFEYDGSAVNTLFTASRDSFVK